MLMKIKHKAVIGTSPREAYSLSYKLYFPLYCITLEYAFFFLLILLQSGFRHIGLEAVILICHFAVLEDVKIRCDICNKHPECGSVYINSAFLKAETIVIQAVCYILYCYLFLPNK